MLAESTRPGILFLSQSHLWTMGPGRGAPSLWLPIQSYLDHGFEVHFVVNVRELGQKQDYTNGRILEGFRAYPYETIVFEKLKSIPLLRHVFKLLWVIYSQTMATIISLRILQKERISIIIVNGSTQVLAGKLLSIFFRLPIVVKYRGTFQLESFTHPLYWLKCWDQVIAMRIPVSLVIMTNDGMQGDKVLMMHGVRPDKFRFWVNGIKTRTPVSDADADATIRHQYGDKNILFMASQLLEEKGVHRMIDAMPAIVKDVPNTILLIAGAGPQQSHLLNQVAKLQIEDNVEFLGAIPWDRLQAYYSISDIFISLYTYSNVGNPLLEALTWGKCIVTIDNYDTKKFIQHGKNGILLKSNKLNELPRWVVSLLRDERERNRLGAGAKSSASILWTWEERTAEEVKTISELIANYNTTHGSEKNQDMCPSKASKC